ncbi:ribosomal protein S5 domain 2-type protein [Talaromyces proteolyticus]|uniref:Ribosomal RNA-processing protein 43 n=1 Tax=Talaromyces proteolyticus TaxID=1131652 RepID=A0AAD4PWG0_9EURO|nr:ribosomal protein S5 domain 2-type protein [Talaromyces proteolyticus]KAH8695050.1 ribosomal protein S5 domain 2-type protein [Talaromyces proteolyticus]
MAPPAATDAPAIPGPSPPSLSLPPSQFARLQPHAYLLAHLSPPPSSQQSPIRANGRTPLEFRYTSANSGSLTHTNGSAVVRIGDTAAVCGVRAEVLHTEDIASWGVSASSSARKRRRTDSGNENGEGDDNDNSQIKDLNLLVPNLSLSTGCAPGFIPGAPPSALAQSLSHRLLSMLHSSHIICEDDLRIWYHPPDFDAIERQQSRKDNEMETDAGEKEDPESPEPEIRGFWVLYIDVMMISLAGNPFDAAWAAVIAALRDTQLPKAWWDVDNDMILCSDEASESKKLNLRGLPVASSFAVFEADAAADWRAVVLPNVEKAKTKQTTREQQRWILADPDGFEENLCQERIWIMVDRNEENNKSKIISMEKNGGLSVGRDELRMLVDICLKRQEQIKDILQAL